MADSTLVIEIMLWVVYCLLAVAIGIAVWSAVHGVRTHEQSKDPLASRHTSMTGYATVALVAVILLITFLSGSTKAILSNGQPFTDAFWLRTTDMFIFTSILLIFICSAIVAIAKFRR